MATLTGSDFLDEDGLLRCNGITSYKLQGAAAQAFKECASGIDKAMSATDFLAEVWHTCKTSKSLNHLAADERCLLLLEIGMSCMELAPKTEWDGTAVLLAELEATGLSSDVKTLGKCLLNIRHALVLLQGPRERRLYAEIHSLVKSVAAQAATVTDPSYNAICLQYQAWAFLARVSLLYFDCEMTVRAGKKACLLKLKSIVHSQHYPRLVLETAHIQALMMDTAARTAYARSYVRKAFAMMTPASAEALIKLLIGFLQIAGIYCPLCRMKKPDNSACGQHGTAYQYMPFCLEVEREMQTTPTWLDHLLCYQWLIAQQQRLNTSQPETPEQTSFVDAIHDELPDNVIARFLMALFDSHRGLSQASFAEQGLQRMIRNVSPLISGGRPLDDLATAFREDALEATREWSELLDSYFVDCGWDLTLVQLVRRYQALDKNLIQDLSDSELLPLLEIFV